MALDPRPAVFLDRDGVIVEDLGYGSGRDQAMLMPGMAEAIRRWQAQGRAIVMVTNQSGIARGKFETSQFHEFQSDVLRALAASGASIDHIEFCPHGPDESCACRKPKPGMLRAAMIRLNLDPKRSIMIGDRETDKEAGEAAGVKSFLFPGGNFFEWVSEEGLLDPL